MAQAIIQAGFLDYVIEKRTSITSAGAGPDRVSGAASAAARRFGPAAPPSPEGHRRPAAAASPPEMVTLRVLSFNVNGLRAILKRRNCTLKKLLDELGAGGRARGIACVPPTCQC